MARGDVIFYRPEGVDAKEDLRPEDFDQFAVLAAYAQTYPYPADDFRPWHHVALSISDDDETVIGFEQPEYQPGRRPRPKEEPATLEMVPGVVEGQARDRLRPPAAIADALVEAMDAMRGAPYADTGLLPFAAITAAWMLPANCVGRDKLRAIAFGASERARQADATAESCTTAVAKAVKGARGQELRLEEPPLPSEAPNAAVARDPRIQAILELVLRLDRSLKPHFEAAFVGPGVNDRRANARGVISRPVTDFVEAVRGAGGPEVRRASLADHLAVLDPDTPLRLDDVNNALNLMALHEAAYFRGPPDDEFYPGGDLPFGAYLALVSAGLEVLDEDLDFEAAGYLRGADSIASEDYLISPAMLWGALLDAGFRKVD